MSDFSQSINLMPDAVDSYVYRSSIFFLSGDLDSALADVDKAVDLAPDWPLGYYYRAKIHDEAGNLRTALNDVATGLQIDPNDKWLLPYQQLLQISLNGLPADAQALRLLPFDVEKSNVTFAVTTRMKGQILDALLEDSASANATILFVAANTAHSLGRLEDAIFFLYAGQMRSEFDSKRFGPSRITASAESQRPGKIQADYAESIISPEIVGTASTAS